MSQKRRDVESKEERKERKRRKGEEKRALKDSQANLLATASEKAKGAITKEGNDRVNADEETLQERKERKRKRKEEKRALKGSQSYESSIMGEAAQAAYNKETEEGANLDKESKDEKQRAKKLKKSKAIKKKEKNGKEELSSIVDENANEQDVSSTQKAKISKEAGPSSGVDLEKEQKNKKKRSNATNGAEKGQADISLEVEKVPSTAISARSADHLSNMQAMMESKEERNHLKELTKKQTGGKVTNAATVISAPRNESALSTNETAAASILTSLKGKGKEPNEQSPASGSGAKQSSGSLTHGSPVSKPASSTNNPPKRNVSAMIDAALRRKVHGGPPSLRTPRDKNTTSSAPGGGQGGGSEDTKESVLADAQHMTHKQLLVEKLYRSHQIKWLQEGVGLKVKQGAFSSWEQDRLQNAVKSFKKKQKMSDEDFSTWMNSGVAARDEKELYASFWRELTASVEDRPNRVIRIFVKRMLKPKTLGSWSDKEIAMLTSAVNKHGERWQDVAKEVASRTAEDCRLRWRDYSDEAMKTRTEGNFTDEELEELKKMVTSVCEEQGIDMTSTSAVIPWKTVAQRLGGTRKPGRYAGKWQRIHRLIQNNDGKEHDQFKSTWTQDDTRKLVRLLSEQRRALEKDDFTEVNLKSLRSEDFNVSTEAMRWTWKQLVSKCASSQDYKQNFVSNLEKVKEGILDGNAFKKRSKAIQSKKKRPQEDVIESEEEV